MDASIRQVVAGLAGGAVFVMAFLLFGFDLVLALALAGGGFLGTLLVLPSKKDIKVNIGDVDSDQLEVVLANGRQRVRALRMLAARIKSASMRDKTLAVAEVVENIYEDFKKDPNDIKQARQFLNYHLEATVNIITKYLELSAVQHHSREVVESMAKVESLMEDVRKAFSRQLAQLLSNDVMNLDTEIKVLESSLKSEGIGLTLGK